MFPKLKINAKYKTFLLPTALFIPLGLIMDFVHEFGHAMWGSLTGGSLTYMQIAYFQVYPKIAVASHFALGLTAMDGLVYGSFEYGLMLLGGYMTTNIFSWILALIPLKTNFGNKEQTALKILGFSELPTSHSTLFSSNRPKPLDSSRRKRTRTPRGREDYGHTQLRALHNYRNLTDRVNPTILQISKREAYG
ncbi:MAG: M50 family metallopeptidase [Candidatus Bathycorpusculaceae bacterium]